MKISFDKNFKHDSIIVLKNSKESKIKSFFLNDADVLKINKLIGKIDLKSKPCVHIMMEIGKKDLEIIILDVKIDSKSKNHEYENLGNDILKIIPCFKKCAIDSSSIAINESKIAAIANGILLRSWSFDKYKTQEKNIKKNKTEYTILCGNPNESEQIFKTNKQVSQSVFLARELVSEPPNILYPESMAKIIKNDLTKHGCKVKILDDKKLQKLNMNAILGVGMGSEKPPCVVVMEWNHGAKDDPYHIFVGKGVTFDTGGISLKPSRGMEDMKYDMAGSAAVVGGMSAICQTKKPINAVGIIALAENMPGHNAQRPSDIVKSMSGQTIEVLNTDAEGRLVLADALWYAHKNYKPKYIVNFATLTGAVVIALGSEYAGLFSNDDRLSANLIKAGEICNEKIWRMPMCENYNKLMNSKAADMQNISTSSGSASSITAAQFLERFVDKNPWAHVDIAGMAWTNRDLATCGQGATGYGVRLIYEMASM